MKRPVAVVGVGQTRHTSRRADVNIAGLVREAVDRALQDAGLEHKDIEAVIVGRILLSIVRQCGRAADIDH